MTFTTGVNPTICSRTLGSPLTASRSSLSIFHTLADGPQIFLPNAHTLRDFVCLALEVAVNITIGGYSFDCLFPTWQVLTLYSATSFFETLSK